MNIFVTNKCPKLSAQALDNKRVVKMVLETAQLLSSAIFINNNRNFNNIYKPTHLRHPCTIWAGTSSGNWNWLLQHFVALCAEYSLRYNKHHASEKILPHFLEYQSSIKIGKITTFVNCTRSESLGIDFKHFKNVHKAYKKYLTVKWNLDKLPPKWLNRKPPLWFKY